MRNIEACPGYLIYFDNIRVDLFVKSFDIQLSKSGGMGRANIEMLYLPDLYQTEQRSTVPGDYNSLLSAIDTIDNMTNVKIFIKNVFNNKYMLTFDGNMRTKSVTRSPEGNSLSYGAVDYMLWLNQTVAPIAIPFKDNLQSSDIFRWEAQGIDTSQTQTISTMADINFKGKTLKEIINGVVSQAIAANRLYYDKRGVGYWDGIVDRIDLMGDIDPDIRNQGILDFVINPNALSVNTLYVFINDLVQKLMFEFFQDRDGIIRVKPPFWNEPVLASHVIDSSIILSSTERSDWSNVTTRVIATGGLDDYQQELYDRFAIGASTPLGAFLGDGVWADYRTFKSSSGGTSLGWANVYEEGKTGISSPMNLDGGSIRHTWSTEEPYTEWLVAGGAGQDVKHMGAKAEVISHDAKASTYDTNGNVILKMLEGPYMGFFIVYRGLTSIGNNVYNTAIIGEGETVGAIRIPASGNYFGVNLRVEVRKPGYLASATGSNTIDPVIYFRDYAENVSTPSIYTMEMRNTVNLLEPTETELRFGPGIMSVSQPMIKHSTVDTLVEDADKNRGALKALRMYSEFIFNMVNSTVKTASFTLVGSPWLRPGFNVWLDPLHTDKIYYIDSISHSGNPSSGVVTHVSAIHGRIRKDFTTNKKGVFGTLGSKDNIFVNVFAKTVNDFGPALASDGQFEEMRKSLRQFHNSSTPVIRADLSMLASLYGSDFNTQKINSPQLQEINAITGARTFTAAQISDLGSSKIPVASGSAPALKRGDKGDSVRKLQEMLKDSGHYKGAIDNSFGPQTEAAVKAFQKANGISDIGIVGAETQKALDVKGPAGAGNNDAMIGKLGGAGLSPASGKLTDAVFSGSLTINQIEAMLDKIYVERAPGVVKSRARKIAIGLNTCRESAKKHYITAALK